MAITTTLLDASVKTFEDAVIEVDEDPTGTPDWNAVESFVGDVQVSGGQVPTANYKTVTKRIVTPGEQDVYQTTLEGVYTELTTDMWYNLWTAFKANPGVAREVRWSDSGTVGEQRFSTIGGKLLLVTMPTPTPNNVAVKTFQAIIESGDITSAVIV